MWREAATSSGMATVRNDIARPALTASRVLTW